MPARGQPGKGYLDMCPTDKSLEELDRDYSEWGGKGPVIFMRSDERDLSVSWGQHEGARLCKIGARGKIWALAWLLVEREKKMGRPRAIAQGAIDWANQEGRLAELMQALPPNVDAVKALQNLISQYAKSFRANAEADRLLLGIMVDYTKAELLKTTAQNIVDAFGRACRGVADSITSYYRSLEQELGQAPRSPVSPAADTRVDWLDSLDLVDLTIARDLASRSKPGNPWKFEPEQPEDATDEYAISIVSYLKMQRSRLIVISGEPFAGKKGKLKAALRTLVTLKGGRLVFSPPEHPDLEMPVRVFAANQLHYSALVQRVAEFLQDYHAAKRKAEMEVPALEACPNYADVEAVRAWIYSSCKHLPAVFVFTDVDAFRRDHARNAVRDIGIIELIDALLSQGTASRVIITTGPLPPGQDESKHLIDLRSPHRVNVPPRRNKEIRKLLPDLNWESLAFSDDTPIRGDDLIAVAATLNLAHTNTRRSNADCEKARDVALAFLDQPVDDRDDARKALYDVLVGQIADRDLLHPLALVAASEDGVRNDSMESLLGIWRNHDPAVRALAKDELDRELGDFMKQATDRFLCHSPIPIYDREEYDFCTRTSPHDEVWEMETMVSVNLLSAIRRRDRLVVDRSHRLIAWIARRRAQMKQVRMRAPVAARARDEASRDIQSYVNLLASLHLTDEPPVLVGPPLRLSEVETFSVDPEVFNPARALRFAYLCLLKEDIDHDYRLSMVFDEDVLRHELYMQLFQPLGELHLTHLTRLELPPELPAHLVSGVFSPDELFDLMTTVGLSAFHAQQFDILDQVVTMAEAYAKTREFDRGQTAVKLARLWCTRIDAMMLLGGATEDRPGLTAIQGWVDEYRSRIPGEGEEDSPLRKAWLRLLAREAELSWLLEGPGQKAATAYGRIETLEANNGQSQPSVMSGRLARRYLRYLLDGVAMTAQREGRLDKEEKAQLIAKAEDLLATNQSRLRRFSGMDRIGVMVDRARLHRTMGNLDEALEYARAAHVRAFAGSASPISKLDVLKVLVECYLAVIRRGMDAQDRPESLSDYFISARRAVRALLIIAQSRHYLPAEAAANFLRVSLDALEFLSTHSDDAQQRLDSAPARLKAGRQLTDRTGNKTHRDIEKAAEAELESAFYHARFGGKNKIH